MVVAAWVGGRGVADLIGRRCLIGSDDDIQQDKNTLTSIERFLSSIKKPMCPLRGKDLRVEEKFMLLIQLERNILL